MTVESYTPVDVQECSRCLLAVGDAEDIHFNEEGLCNYCQYYDSIAEKNLLPEKERTKKLDEMVSAMKAAGKGKKYDCLIGISGGVDSTYVAYYVKQVLGLRPLAVHLDYGWNSELAVMNINHVLDKLDIDLYTYVVEWDEIKDLQLAFLQASVVDIELLNDFAIFATMYNVAYKNGIKYILNGGNIATEGGKLPKGWTWHKFDQKNILAIHKAYGKKRLKSFPKLSFWKKLYLDLGYKMTYMGFLNLVD